MVPSLTPYDLPFPPKWGFHMIRLFVQYRNTTQQYNKQEIRKKKLDKRNVREVPKQTLVNMPLGLIKCNINFIKKLLTVFLITRNFKHYL